MYETGRGDGLALGSHWETLQWLRVRGFRTNPHAKRHDSLESVARECAEWEHKRLELDYEIDGIVIKVDSTSSSAWRAARRLAGREPSSGRR